MKCPFDGCNFDRWDALQSGIGEHFYDKHELDCCKQLGELIEKIQTRIKELEKYIGWEPTQQENIPIVRELKKLLD